MGGARRFPSRSRGLRFFLLAMGRTGATLPPILGAITLHSLNHYS